LSVALVAVSVPARELDRYQLGAAAESVSLPYRRSDEALYSANRGKTYFGEDVAAAKIHFEYGLTGDALGLQLRGYIKVDGSPDYRLRALYRRPRGSTRFQYAVDGCHRDGTVYLAATGDVSFDPVGEEVDHDPGHKRLRDVVRPAAVRLAELEFVCGHGDAYDHVVDTELFEDVASFLTGRDELFENDV
jgi:hypothetical protein